MQLLKTTKKIYLVAFLTLAMSACSSRLEKHGFMFDLSDYQQLQEGVTTKNRVLKTMGAPTLVSDFDGDETWIYMAQDLRYFLFFNPDIESRTVLAIKFDQEQNISELLNLSLADENKNFEFESKFTAVDSHKIGFFKSLFSNVGQVKPQ